jgi:3-deoxy-D-manno-octulosonic acid kinase
MDDACSHAQRFRVHGTLAADEKNEPSLCSYRAIDSHAPVPWIVSRMTGELFASVPGGGIVYDASLPRKPDARWFTREYWSAQGIATDVIGGRGSVCFVRTDLGAWVLRHYNRGGFIARFSKDRYLWLGAARTRSFAEWRLLAELRRRGLPVPEPIAAYYQRSGSTYSADLITRELPPSKTLAVRMKEGLSKEDWIAVGRTIARFHANGVHHADLNANNILLSDTSEVYLLDFDRARIRSRGSWEQQVLKRLHRSLKKIALREQAEFGEREWRSLLMGINSE